MMEGMMTDAQRKLLFSKMGEENVSKDDLEENLGFSISDLTKGEASILIDCFIHKGEIDETAKVIRENHEESPAKENQINSENAIISKAGEKVEMPGMPKSQDGLVDKQSPAQMDWSAIQTNPSMYVQMLNRLYLHLLQKGTDYGVIPGTKKPTLYKPGAELLAMNLGLTTATSETTEMQAIAGMFIISTKAHTEVFYKGNKVGDGYGSCSTAETKYAFRWVAEKKLAPNTDRNSLVMEESEYGRRYRVPSSVNETFDAANTVLKMAKKRSFIDAVLTVTGASRIFTQDLEDIKEAL